MQTAAMAIKNYAAAVASERIAWDALRGRLPGSASYSEELWRNWRTAVDEADRAAARAKTLVPQRAAPTGSSVIGTVRPPAVQLPPIFIRLWRHRSIP
jgi:hypothetical protein